MTLVTNIQRFAIDDGPGLRTTAFFKGCPLACAWCHNPECISFEAEQMFFDERCVHCGQCQSGGQCPRQARQTVGQCYSPDRLARELLRDRAFYERSGGGVTLSGGEALAQDGEYLRALLEQLSGEGAHIAVDTCGFAPFSAFELALPHTDLFLYDLKLMDDERHIRFTGQSNALILQNLARLARAGAAIELRLPLIGGVNDSRADLQAVCDFLRREKIEPRAITALAYHSMGESKRERLGLPPGEAFSPPKREVLEVFAENGFHNVHFNR